MPHLHYFCLCTYSRVRHILCCVFVLFFVILCTLCSQFLWIVPYFLFIAPSVFSKVYLHAYPLILPLLFHLTVYLYKWHLNTGMSNLQFIWQYLKLVIERDILQWKHKDFNDHKQSDRNLKIWIRTIIHGLNRSIWPTFHPSLNVQIVNN